MMMHPQARPIIAELALPFPIRKYFSHLDWEIDLSNNTNPYLGDEAQYPDVKQDQLKDLYLQTILSLNPPPALEKNNTGALSSSNILLTVGAMEGADLLLRTFAEPYKDVVCVTHPSFFGYEHWARLHSLQVKKIPLLGNQLNQIDIKEVITLNPKLTFICNPNNPTGTRLEEGILQKLCESLNGLVIVDEAYIEFSDSASSIFYFNTYKNLVILRTFSKAWGLASVRCGAIIADPLIINALRYVQLPFGVSSFSQEKVRAQLLYPQKTFASWQRIKKDRTALMEDLSTLPNVATVFQSDTNFIMLVLKNFQKMMERLKKHKIHVLDCSSLFPNSIRVSLGTEKQNRTFLEAITA